MRTRRFERILAVIVPGAILSFAMLAGCGPSPNTIRQRAAATNFLLVTLDTTRPDALGCYGGKRVETPNLDRLARSGVRFDCAVSAVPLTLPSHATILTGSYPICHGVRNNGTFRLSDKIPTLAERLKAKGFSTGAVVGAFVLDASFGLVRGFDEYDDRMPSREMGRRAFKAERRAEEVTASALAFLQRQSEDRPFMLWVHYYDPHSPYAPPSPYAERFAGDPRRAYDGEVAYMDSEVGRLVDAASRRRRPTITLVLADHGEAFGERGETNHGMLLYDTTTRVPMILHAPGIAKAGTSVASMVRTVDVVPTLAEIYDFPVGPEVQGRSLWPLVLGETEPEPREAYLETYAPELEFGWSPLRAIRTTASKLIDAPDGEFFDFASDPREERNAIAVRAADAAAARARLDALVARDTCADGREVRPAAADEETRRRLEALGYAQGAPAASTTNGERPKLEDPKKKVEVFAKFSYGNGLILAGKAAEAASVFESLAATEATNVKVLDSLAEAYSDANRLDDAERTLKKAIAIRPAYVDAITDLGLVQFRAKKFEDANETYAKALEFDPRSGAALFGRARSLEQLGRNDDALAAYRKAVDAAPANVDGRLAYATFLSSRMNRKDDAQAELLAILKKDSGFYPAAFDLGMVRVSTGDWQGAAEALEIARRSVPRDPRTYLPLAAAYEHTNQMDRARDVLLQAVEIDGKNPAVLCHLGAVLAPRERGKDAAFGYFSRAIQANPDAVESFRGSLDEWPNSIAVRITLAQALSAAGRNEDAAKEFAIVVGKEPKNFQAREYLGVVQSNLKRYADAESTLRHVLEEAPNRASTLNELAWMLVTADDPSVRKPAAAVELAERAVSLQPNDAGFLDTLSRAYESVGSFDKALDAMQRASKLAPKDAEMKKRVADLEARRKSSR
ncbi:MAG: sulfatase-like hydrolase/transferase [Planctomycetes bacterium]|nr:sulfatase-like hydrolase/transferase [Planctomycetota bacterium]